MMEVSPHIGAHDEQAATSRFESLYAEFHPRIVEYGLRRTRPEEARDIAAETFAVVWQRLPEVPSDAAPWIFATARNILMASGRREARWTPTLCRESELVIGDHSETVAQVLDALKDMRQDDREVLMLVAWEGLAPKQAAAVVGCSKGTFLVRLHRARRRLQSLLDRHEISEGQVP